MERDELTDAGLGLLVGMLHGARDTGAEELARIDADLADVMAARSDGTADDEHDPEGTPLSAEWSRLAGARDYAVRTRAEVDRALARVAAGTYGTCIRCSRPIGFARLEARPAAELCIDCAS